MDYLLIAITAASAGVAIVMCAIVIRMVREQRRRSDARVEALVAMANGSADVPGEGPRVFESSPADLPFNRPSHVAGVETLFAAQERSSPWPRRLGAAAIGVALLGAAVAGLTWSTRGGAPAEEQHTSANAAAPLELVSLTHSTGSKALTITGLVQNPPGGAALAGVTAVALLFSPDGAFVASGRAPLDFARLDPGSESPFVIDVPTTKRVARYRVSFRASDGAVIAHVDRRNAPGHARDALDRTAGAAPVARRE